MTPDADPSGRFADAARRPAPPRPPILRSRLAGVSALLLLVFAPVAGASTPRPLAPVVFFPPTAPVLGAPIPDRPAGRMMIYEGRATRPPPGVEEFVGDYLYPALGTRRFSRDLSASVEARLHAYRARRLQHVSALLNQFVRLFEQPDDVVERELRAFAETQTPQLVALEHDAEQLRQQLVADGWRNGIDWNAARRWKLDPRKEHADWADAEAHFQVVRAAAYYQKGLLPEQRGLLCELALELQQAARKARGQPGTRAESDVIAFSPATARFRLPAATPAALREKIASYHRRRSAIKRELHDLLLAQDRESAASRTKAFEALADRQWPEISELESLADEIRPALSNSLALKPPPAPPWLPAGLIEFIRSYNADRDVYFRELNAATDAAVAAVPKPARTSENYDDEYIAYSSQADQAHRAALRDFQSAHLDRYRDLERRYHTIRETLQVVAEKQQDPQTGKPLTAETLLRLHAASLEEFNTFGRDATMYTHYRLAMLQPGLSPPQRRLLFNYAIAGLAQPLPYGELMPTRQMTRPNPAP